MIQHVVAVKDRALDAFMRPFCTPTLGAAIRSFQDEVNRKDSELNKHPEDYDLWHIADWDDNSGDFKTIKPQQIAIGKNVLTNGA